MQCSPSALETYPHNEVAACPCLDPGDDIGEPGSGDQQTALDQDEAHLW